MCVSVAYLKDGIGVDSEIQLGWVLQIEFEIQRGREGERESEGGYLKNGIGVDCKVLFERAIEERVEQVQQVNLRERDRDRERQEKNQTFWRGMRKRERKREPTKGE